MSDTFKFDVRVNKTVQLHKKEPSVRAPPGV